MLRAKWIVDDRFESSSSRRICDRGDNTSTIGAIRKPTRVIHDDGGCNGAGTGISIVQGSGRTSYGLLRRRTISNKQTNEWEAKEVADIKVFVTELASYYSELSEEVSSSGRTNSITSSLPSTTIRSLLSNRGSSSVRPLSFAGLSLGRCNLGDRPLINVSFVSISRRGFDYERVALQLQTLTKFPLTSAIRNFRQTSNPRCVIKKIFAIQIKSSSRSFSSELGNRGWTLNFGTLIQRKDLRRLIRSLAIEKSESVRRKEFPCCSQRIILRQTMFINWSQWWSKLILAVLET